MSGCDGFKRIIFVTTAAAVPFWSSQPAQSSSAVTVTVTSRIVGIPRNNPLGAELERCRKVTSEQSGRTRRSAV